MRISQFTCLLLIPTLLSAGLLCVPPSRSRASGDDAQRFRERFSELENERPVAAFVMSGRCFVRGFEIFEFGAGGVLKSAAIADGKPQTSIVIPIHSFTHFSLLYGRLYATEAHYGNLALYNLSDLLGGKLTTGDANNKRAVADFSESWIFRPEQNSVWNLHGPVGGAYGPYADFHYDYLPLSQDSVRLLLLSKRPLHAYPGRLTRKAKSALEDANVAGLLGGDGLYLTSAKYQAKWDPEKEERDSETGEWKIGNGGWGLGTWSDPETLEASFDEPFHAYLLNDHYYFVTKSGKVYVSPPLKAGETGVRKVTPFWTDPQKPITHLLTHVDGKTPHLTYAFGDNQQPGKPKKQEKFYFELQGAEPKLNYFHGKQLQSAQVEEPLKTMLEYARLIVNGPQAGSDEPDLPPEIEPEKPGTSRTWLIAMGAAVGLLLVAAAFLFWLRRQRSAAI